MQFAPVLDMTVPQVCPCYPKDTEAFAGELIQLLDTHHAVLDPPLRRSLVKALILLRNRGQVCALHPSHTLCVTA